MSKTALNWINSEWIDSGSHQDSFNPATGQKIGVFADGGQKRKEPYMVVDAVGGTS
jgi:betaine-aldehyde dehydrogenase